DAGGPDAFVAAGGETNPAVDETAAVVVGEGGGLSGSAGEGAGEKIGFDQDLEAVADSDDRFSGFDETAEIVGKMVDDLIGKDFSGGDVVAVAEAAGEG